MKEIIQIIFLLLIFASLFFIFKKAGEKSWKALIPGYNLWVWLKVIHKPWWWIIILLFPGPNILLLMIMSANTATVMGQRSSKDMFLAGVFPFFYMPYLALSSDIGYMGPIDRKVYPKNAMQEWRDAILFAVVAAMLIRTYTLEAFTIPTSSMEKSMLIGDYLFVDKVSYGTRIPETPLSFPLVHHSLPLTNNSVPSYLKWINFGYHRLPGFRTIKNNDIVVFNFPEGDTVDIKMQSNQSYNAILRERAFKAMYKDFNAGRKVKPLHSYVNNERQKYLDDESFTVRPVDKRENYIKRCVGIPGDKIEIIHGELLVNDKPADAPKNLQYNYYVETKNPYPLTPENRRVLKKKYNINYQDMISIGGNNQIFRFPLTNKDYNAFKADPMVKNIIKAEHKKGEFSLIQRMILRDRFSPRFAKYLKKKELFDPEYSIFPNAPNFNWTADNFGPLTIPKKGETVELTTENLPLYKRVIDVYEGDQLEVKDGSIYINDKETDRYTFKMNYYWLMGDNRHNSQDSRFWGFVPEDHVVGRAAFVWFSMDPELDMSDGKIRWSRIFTGAHSN